MICKIKKEPLILTEEEKNTQAAEAAKGQGKDEEEDDEFKVVMPEANRTTMPDETYEEQPDYLQVFANFYITEFNAKDLEIMNGFDNKHNCVDINHYLQNNIHFSRKDLIKHALHRHAYNFQDLLDSIQEKTGLDYKSLKTYQDWVNWYEDQRRQIPGSLS